MLHRGVLCVRKWCRWVWVLWRVPSGEKDGGVPGGHQPSNHVSHLPPRCDAAPKAPRTSLQRTHKEGTDMTQLPPETPRHTKSYPTHHILPDTPNPTRHTKFYPTHQILPDTSHPMTSEATQILTDDTSHPNRHIKS